jgi:two-component system KDP operon response regulator KdpE
MSLTVLLVEDDRELRVTLREALAVEGYRVVASASLADAQAVLAHDAGSSNIDLVLLDLGLPDGDGQILLGKPEARPRHAGDRDLGAALRRPQDPAARRRGRRLPGQALRLANCWRACAWPCATAARACSPRSPHYRHNDLGRRPGHAARAPRARCAPHAHRIQAAGAAGAQAGQVVTHRQLLADVWGAEFVQHTHYLRLYMAQLRAKLEADPADPQLLLTETGVGYRLAEPAA